MRIQVVLIKKGTLEKIEGTKFWKVATPYIWEIRNGHVRTIEIPKGFITDFGSIPRILWIILNPTEYHTYILHDYLYKYRKVKRNVADYSLQIGILSEGAGQMDAALVWWGVFLGGWIYYYFHKTKTYTYEGA